MPEDTIMVLIGEPTKPNELGRAKHNEETDKRSRADVIEADGRVSDTARIVKALCKTEAGFKAFKQDNPIRASNPKLSRFYRRSINSARWRYLRRMLRLQVQGFDR
jgi:hypothetical protein